MSDFVSRVGARLKEEGISFRQDAAALRIALPNMFGELEISELEGGDTVIGLVDHEWHTHGDLLKAYGASDEVEATISFVKGIFQGEFLLVEEVGTDGAARRTIEDDLDSFREDLPEKAIYRVFNGPEAKNR